MHFAKFSTFSKRAESVRRKPMSRSGRVGKRGPKTYVGQNLAPIQRIFDFTDVFFLAACCTRFGARIGPTQPNSFGCWGVFPPLIYIPSARHHCQATTGSVGVKWAQKHAIWHNVGSHPTDCRFERCVFPGILDLISGAKEPDRRQIAVFIRSKHLN